MLRTPVNVDELLIATRSDVLDDACASLEGAQVHYDRSGEAFIRERLGELFDLVVTALQERELEPVGVFCEDVAERRFNAGFELAEVQTAFNALDVAMWQQVVAGVPAEELADAIGLLGTVLGHGKDALARRYVSLATHRRVPTLDYSALFAGAAG